MIANRSVPGSTVIPELPYPDVVEASDWLCAAFGFRERLRIADHRAQLEYGSGAVIVTQGSGGAGSVCSYESRTPTRITTRLWRRAPAS